MKVKNAFEIYYKFHDLSHEIDMKDSKKNGAVNCMIDWLEFSVFHQDIDTVLRILDITDLAYENRKGFYYKEMLVFDNCIYISKGIKGNAEDNHVHVKFTGRGCRFMERKLNAKCIRDEVQGRFCLPGDEVKVSRMDICVDYDHKFVLDFMDDVFEKKLSGIRTTQICGEKGNGMTLYLGSRKSDKFFRLYEKDFESGNFGVFKDRVELVLKDEYATFEFNNENDLFKIISAYMDDIKFDENALQERWDNMKGERCEISPKIRHKKTTLEEKTDYILNTFGKTLKAYAEQYGTQKITEAIHEAVLSQKDIRMLNNAKVISFINARKRLDRRMEKPKKQVYKQDEFAV